VVRWQRRRRDGHVERVGGGLGFAAWSSTSSCEVLLHQVWSSTSSREIVLHEVPIMK
jgi:hypothetical protein